MRFRQALEIAKRLKQHDLEPMICNHLANIARGAVEGDEILLKDFNAIEACGDNVHDRTNHMAMRVLARPFDAEEHALLEPSLYAFRKTYSEDPSAAEQLIAIGDSKPNKTIPAPELATWTMIASQILNFDEAITKH